MASIAMLNSASYKHVPIMLRAALRSQRNYTTDQLAELIKMNVPERKLKYVPETGTYPKGFQVGAAHAGVKASNTTGYPDIALISSVGETPCRGAGLFTRNKFQAAPVQVSRKLLGRKRPFQINNVIINAGCANAVTGKKGLEDAESMVRKTDEVTGQPENSSLVMSTGVIGQALPIDKILNTIPVAHSNLASSHESWLQAARAICTTDTFPKLITRTFTLPSSPGFTYTMAGMAKGAGMICPNMGTLLGVICTDAPIGAPFLKPLLKQAVMDSFNSISVDGDTSTNDSIALLANGAAGGNLISDTRGPNYIAFQNELKTFAQELAQLVVRDGEGATKFVTIRVKNYSNGKANGKRIAAAIAKSPLVKTALYGKDANWGRILCAIGYAPEVASGVVVPERTSVSFKPTDGSEELKLLVNGEPEQVDEKRAAEVLAAEDLEIVVDLQGGAAGEKACGSEDLLYWTCDFSHEYVTINGDYRT